MFAKALQGIAILKQRWGFIRTRVHNFAELNIKNSVQNRYNERKAPDLGAFLAQREGFEPSVPLRGTHDFQSCSLGRSDISAKKPI